MVWSLALRSDDAKQDPVVCGTKFGVVFLVEGPRTASIQKGFDGFGLYHPGLESVDEGNLQVIDVDVILENCPINSRPCQLRIDYLMEDERGPQWRAERAEIFIFGNILWRSEIA